MTEVSKENSCLETVVRNVGAELPYGNLIADVELFRTRTAEGWDAETAKPGDTIHGLIKQVCEDVSDFHNVIDEINVDFDISIDQAVLIDIAFSISEKMSRLSSLCGLPPKTFHGKHISSEETAWLHVLGD